METPAPFAAPESCHHCQLPIPQGVEIQQDDHAFCCRACLTVHNFIQSAKLGDYYQIREDLGVEERQRPLDFEEFSERYRIYQDETWKNKYLQAGEGVDQFKAKFFVEGMHCFACVWLLEKLPEVQREIDTIRVNFFEKTLEIELTGKDGFAQAVKDVERLGYRLHSVANQAEVDAHKTNSQKRMLSEIAVAAGCAGNIMICAVAVYSGARGSWEYYLNSVSALLFLPVLFYSSRSIFHNAWSSLINRRYSLDIAAAFSLILGSALSYYQLLSVGSAANGEAVYFDSLSAFVFLLLASRYLLARGNARVSSLDCLDLQLTTSKCKRMRQGGIWAEVDATEVSPGDILKIAPGDVLPTDVLVVDGQSRIDNSLINGESEALKVEKGAKLSAGGKNLVGELMVQALSSAGESSLHKLFENLKQGWQRKGLLLNWTEQISSALFAYVLVASSLTAFTLVSAGNTEEALVRILAILVIACPCALGIGAPLVLSRALRALAEKGVVAKNSDVIHFAAKLKTVFFDKTGTLTEGKLKVVDFDLVDSAERQEVLQAIFTLESSSLHPVAQSLKDYAQSCASVEQQDTVNSEVSIEEIPGRGIQGSIAGITWLIEKDESVIRQSELSEKASQVCVRRDGKIVARILLEDGLKPSSQKMVSNLEAMGLRVGLLSGDRPSVVEFWADKLGIVSHKALSSLSPEAKLEAIRKTENVAMVGDGVNDAMALSLADIGIAVNGSLGASKASGNVLLMDDDMSKVSHLIDYSRRVMGFMKAVVAFAFLFNSAGITLAALGYINPLVAAVLMPVSSLVVVGAVSAFFKTARNLDLANTRILRRGEVLSR